MEISNGIHMIPGTIANIYLIIETGGLTLIDSGLPSSVSKITNYLDLLGYSPGHIRHIIITHADDDHYGSLAKIKEISGARSYTSAIEAKAIKLGENSRHLRLNGPKKYAYKALRWMVHARPCIIDQVLDDGNILPILGGLKVIATPGHTPGHISLYTSAHRTLFAGDSMRSHNGVLNVSRGINTWDEHEAHISVRKQAQLGARIVCVGHGPVVYEAEGKFPPIR